mmetsp:Transcript_11408/g.33825  ORF Transcript_11408/g.33825 Transcript_11408/m.33825 type:complete len:89 (-) Transcript_11408:328-594(-)
MSIGLRGFCSGPGFQAFMRRAWCSTAESTRSPICGRLKVEVSLPYVDVGDPYAVEGVDLHQVSSSDILAEGVAQHLSLGTGAGEAQTS